MDSTTDSRKPRKYLRYVIATMVAGVVFAVAYGFAAALSLTTTSLGAATTAVAACQSATLSVTYAPTYASGIPGYAPGTVTVSGLTSSCYSKDYRITLSGSGGTLPAEQTGTTPSSGATFTATFAAVDASAVTDIAVVISG
jgi:hypothetical protein